MTTSPATCDLPTRFLSLYRAGRLNEPHPSKALLDEVIEHLHVRKEYALMDRVSQANMTEGQRLARELEALPRNWEAVKTRKPLAFVLMKGEGGDYEWWPAYNYEGPNANGVITAGIEQADGTRFTWPTGMGSWAECTADNGPSMPGVEW